MHDCRRVPIGGMGRDYSNNVRWIDTRSSQRPNSPDPSTAHEVRARRRATISEKNSSRRGGRITYGPELATHYALVAEYVDKILKGAKPGDLPVQQPTQFTLIINLKTAKALGLTVPQSFLVRADEVIQ